MKVTNAELLLEIHRSRLTYTDLTRSQQRELGQTIPDLHVSDLADIPAGHRGLVKLWSRDHLPDDYVTPFAPFRLVRDSVTIASAFVDRSGDPSIHGRLTDRLGVLIYNLVINYSRKPNWSNYTYLDEMISHALEAAMVPVLRYDERKSNNPFAFLTTNTFYAFAKIQKREAQVNRHRNAIVTHDLNACQWSVWQSSQNEEANSEVAIYDELCAEMDLLNRDEIDRRLSGSQQPRTQKYKLRMTPILAAAIKYGLSAGLSGAAIATHFGLEPATVTRVKNNINRTKSAINSPS
jgi:hypothetical protein